MYNRSSLQTLTQLMNFFLYTITYILYINLFLHFKYLNYSALKILVFNRSNFTNFLFQGGVSACLKFVDFFNITAQRAALTITANCCQNLSHEDFHLVADSLPLLTSRLTNQDKKSVECVCQAFSRLVDSFQQDPVMLHKIINAELLQNLQQLVRLFSLKYLLLFSFFIHYFVRSYYSL